MKQLSDTLEAMKLPKVSPRTAQAGSTATGSQIAIQHRNSPLTESEHTAILSRLLQKPPLLRLTRVRTFGNKPKPNEFGHDVVADDEETYDIDFTYKPNVEVKLIEAALRHSPPSATLDHLTRLSLHKRLGSSDKDRVILFNDYSVALRGFSDFVVFLACKLFWENDDNGFYPKIKSLVSLCQVIQKKTGTHEIENKPRPTYYKTPKDNPIRRTLCDFLIAKGKPDYFNEDRMNSNYQLEIEARGLGWKPDDC